MNSSEKIIRNNRTVGERLSVAQTICRDEGKVRTRIEPYRRTSLNMYERKRLNGERKGPFTASFLAVLILPFSFLFDL